MLWSHIENGGDQNMIDRGPLPKASSKPHQEARSHKYKGDLCKSKRI